MCTAIIYNNYFGRNLDLDSSYNEQIIITPRKFPIKYRKENICSNHFAYIGMAAYYNNTPLYYDGTNEKGLYCAGLNFPDNARYLPYVENVYNITPFEFIPWILSQCSDISDAKELISKTNLINIPFSEALPLSPLHFLIADKSGAIVVEPTAEGLMVYDDPNGVLTNNPPFLTQLFNLNNYMNLTAKTPTNRFYDTADLEPYSYGMGAIGLPGDWSSASRFVRATFVKLNSPRFSNDDECVNQAFHILNSVAMPKGSIIMPNGEYEHTIYTCCMNGGRYFYTTYNSAIRGCVDMNKEDLTTKKLIFYPLQH